MRRRLPCVLTCLAVVLALPGLGLFGNCGGGFNPPESQSCASPDSVTLTTLELMRMDTVIEDGASLPIVYGTQGGTMISFHLSYETADPAPDCFAQSTTVTLSGDGGVADDTYTETRPLEAFPDGATEAMWFIGSFSPGQQATLHTEAYGVTLDRHVVLE